MPERMKQLFLFARAVLILAGGGALFCQSPAGSESATAPIAGNLSPLEECEIFRRAYPQARFTPGYDEKAADWTVTVESHSKKTLLYWCGGAYLPESELANRARYTSVIYPYGREGTDLADFTSKQIERIREYSSESNRKNGQISSTFIFDAIYDCRTRADAESHLRSMTLWGKPLCVHRDIGAAVGRVEARVNALSRTDETVAAFLRGLSGAEGFIWGGRWEIWDNMHFEYRPELLAAARRGEDSPR